MIDLRFRDCLIASALSLNVVFIISCAFNMPIWSLLIASTIFLGLSLSMLIMGDEE